MKSFIEKGLKIERLALQESLMSIGNGYMGTRGYLEEFQYPNSVRGNYINGIYEHVPMVHAEWAYGFPLESDRMPNLIDLFKLLIRLDREEVLIDGNIQDFKRELDFEEGLSRRSYKYVTKSGKIAWINFEHLISLPYKELKTWSLNIQFDGEIEVINRIDFEISNLASKEDPRLAPNQIPLVDLVESHYDSKDGKILLRTITSDLEVKMDFKDEGVFDSSWDLDQEGLNIYFRSKGNLELNRIVKYWDSIRNIKRDWISKEELYRSQIEYLKDFNNKSSIEFLDHEDLDNAIDFMRFHLLQSTSQDPYGNIAAKGLSGEGYEGHYFWDTEIFLYPVWLLWDKERAKNLLIYRYNLLDSARKRAKEMGHQKGACFPWRTISGIESSGYFPAGSAQYHINFDIAYTFIQWWLVGYDMDFLVNYSMELLLETARTVLEIGAFQSDGFHIHGVTGPDEYTTMVSDNYYTNKMAQYNLIWAVRLWEILENENFEEWLKLKEKLHIEDGEIEAMERAAREMVLLYDEERAIIAQDSTFLKKALWPEENKLRPLLLHYHPLTIYRYQVLKQSDAVLALYLIGDEEEEIIRRTYYYYENISTHDSSLSPCISGLMACRLKDERKAYDYFMDSIFMDLKDLNKNTSDGLHMANIGGSLSSILRGFAGIRIEEDGLHIDPFVPKEIGRIKLRFTWRKAILELLVYDDQVDLKKISGPPVDIIVKGRRLSLGQKAVLFDLDGVLTGTSDNHYEGWKRMCKDLGLDLPEEFRDSLRGISRKEALDMILEYFDLDFSEDQRLELMNRKNNYYKESIKSFSKANLYPGVVDLLEDIKNRGYKIGLVSASKNARQLVKNMEIEEYFDAIVDPEKVKGKKPEPDPFLAAAKMLFLKPETCLGVEDAKAGIESIKAAGMKALGIGSDDLGEADAVFDTIKNAASYILEWLEGV